MAQPDWIAHANSVTTIVGFLVAGLFTIVCWFLIRTIGKIDANQTELFKKYGDHEHRLSVLEGSHAARTEMNVRC